MLLGMHSTGSVPPGSALGDELGRLDGSPPTAQVAMEQLVDSYNDAPQESLYEAHEAPPLPRPSLEAAAALPAVLSGHDESPPFPSNQLCSFSHSSGFNVPPAPTSNLPFEDGSHFPAAIAQFVNEAPSLVHLAQRHLTDAADLALKALRSFSSRRPFANRSGRDAAAKTVELCLFAIGLLEPSDPLVHAAMAQVDKSMKVMQQLETCEKAESADLVTGFNTVDDPSQISYSEFFGPGLFSGHVPDDTVELVPPRIDCHVSSTISALLTMSNLSGATSTAPVLQPAAWPSLSASRLAADATLVDPIAPSEAPPEPASMPAEAFQQVPTPRVQPKLSNLLISDPQVLASFHHATPSEHHRSDAPETGTSAAPETRWTFSLGRDCDPLSVTRGIVRAW